MEEVNDRSTAVITVGLKDENGNAVTPSAATYRIDDVDSGTQILDDTAFPSLASQVDLEITDAQNALLDETKPYESRKITVKFDYGSGKKGTAQYIYRIKNLSGVTNP